MAIKNYRDNALYRFFGITNRSGECITVAGMAVLLLHWFVMVWFVLSRLEDLSFLRLHYTVALGVDWVDVWWKIFIYPGLGLIIFLINGFIAGQVNKQYKILAQIIMVITVFLEIIFAVGGLMAILLNA